MAKNPYIVLGIDRGAGRQDIKQAYRRAVKKSPPDLSREKKRSALQLPPAIADGTRVSLRLEEVGMPPGALHLQFRIDPWAA